LLEDTVLKMSKKVAQLFLHHMLMAGLMLDGNPGVMRTIRQLEKAKEVQNARPIPETTRTTPLETKGLYT